MPFLDSSFDAVLCTGVLMHVPNQRVVIREISRVLRPGGRIVLSGNNLLSPFSAAVALWVKVCKRPRQSFKAPWFYRKELAKSGIQVERVVGDTVLAVALTIPGSRRAVLPEALYPALVAIDRWADRVPLNHLAYEVWFSGRKQNGSPDAPVFCGWSERV